MNDQVTEIKSKTDIATIIGERVELKKAGSNLKGLCPFHSEKSPSFMVSPELQIFKCFGCGKSGDVFTFMDEFEGMEFYESLKYLADRLGIKLKVAESQKKGIKERFYEVNALVARFYHYVLLEHEAGKAALDYITRERGLTLNTLKIFKLGFSPDLPFTLKKFVVDRNRVKMEELEQAGVIWVRVGRSGDRFRGRLVFPLFDHRGNNIGFAGRILPSSDRKDAAKYINSPETAVYHKSHVLYGLNETRQYIKREGYAIIVEGELDLISSWQVGIKNVVAIKGSALTEDQVRLLSRFTKKLVFALDADFAGNEAAKRGIFIAQHEGLEVSVASLKKFKDPDEAARSDPDAYRKAISDSVGIWDFMINFVIKKYNGDTGEEKSRISKELIPLLAQIEDRIVQAHYVNLLARKLQVPVEAVSGQIENLVRKQNNPPRIVSIMPTAESGKSRKEMLEERLVALIFKTDMSLLGERSVEELVETPLMRKIINAYHELGDKKFDIKEFAKGLPPELTLGFSDLMMQELEGLQDYGKSDLKQELSTVIRELKILNIRSKLDALAKKIGRSEEADTSEGLQEREKEFTELTKELQELESAKL